MKELVLQKMGKKKKKIFKKLKKKQRKEKVEKNIVIPKCGVGGRKLFKESIVTQRLHR